MLQKPPVCGTGKGQEPRRPRLRGGKPCGGEGRAEQPAPHVGTGQHEPGACVTPALVACRLTAPGGVGGSPLPRRVRGSGGSGGSTRARFLPVCAGGPEPHQGLLSVSAVKKRCLI